MEESLYTINSHDITGCDSLNKEEIITALEEGKIIYYPNYHLIPNDSEINLLNANVLDINSKNISYNYLKSTLAGVANDDKIAENMRGFMHKYAVFAKQLVDTALPHYSSSLIWGRTSFRPAEIKGRKTSKRKDDTRVHVDAFPATPVAGKRILRVFCNVNPNGESRVWNVGEPFGSLLAKYKDKIPPYSNLKAVLLNIAKVTKTKRTAYDHYMLNLHDTMKLDDEYQQNLDKKVIKFPPNSTWIVYTDKVSHAAMSGQFLLEQTFYLSTENMQNPKLSPKSHLESCGLI